MLGSGFAAGHHLRLALVATSLLVLGVVGRPAAAQPTTVTYQLNGGAWASDWAEAVYPVTGMPFTLELRVVVPGYDVEYRLDGGAWASNGAPATTLFNSGPQPFSMSVRIAGHHVEYQVYGAWSGWSYVRSEGDPAESAYANMPSSIIVRIAVPPAADTAPPETTHSFSGTLGPGGVFLGPVSVELPSTDDRTGVRTTFFSVDGGPSNVYTGPFSVGTAGVHTLEYYSEDNAGNVEAIRATSLEVEIGVQVQRVPEDHATIQAAIDAAFDAGGGVVAVGPGTYFERPVLRPGVVLRSADGPAATTIHGSGGSPVVTMADDSTLSGLTVRGAGGWNGVAVLSSSGAPVISGNIITNNGGSGDPSAVTCGGGSPLIIGNVIRSGFHGIRVGACEPTVVNNVVASNSRWGLYAMSGSHAVVVNNVFVENFAGHFFGTTNSYVFARNNIFYGGGRQMFCSPNPSPGAVMDFDYNLAYDTNSPSGCSRGPNAILADPLFVDAAAGDFRLTSGSPAVDAADDAAPGLPAMDADGNERRWDGDGDGFVAIDIGAYELGAPPCVDSDDDGVCDAPNLCAPAPECAAPGVDAVYFATVTDEAGAPIGSIRCALSAGALSCDTDPQTGELVVTPTLWCSAEGVPQ